ncbi:MAG: threonylcarbamoyl-AMP synthase [Saprospiraceae bacterium]|nr:threonylcarbamoyl-AMP synthase [Saprospiraceae bacterium]
MIGTDIHRAVQLLRDGKLVGIPTETVYGLAGNALDEWAVTQIFEVKGRPAFNPLILHVAHTEQLANYAKVIPEPLWKLVKSFMPGPLTILVEKKDIVPDIVTAGSHRVAIRVPAHPVSRMLLNHLDFPLAAPSANPFGYISPTSARHVENQLGDKIPYILDGGECTIGLESSIVGMEGDKLIVYRKGGLAVEDIEAVAGPVEVKVHSSSNPEAPGMLSAHYAPGKPLLLGNIPALIQTHKEKHFAVISFKTHYVTGKEVPQFALSPSADLHEAARNLFRVMREIDELPVDIILAEYLPEEGLGRAINDRLTRASTPMQQDTLV